MKVQVRFRGIEASRVLAAHVTGKVHQHLSRFGRQVRDVVVRLSDLNGPRGGRDKLCQIDAKGKGIGLLHLSEIQDDFYAGVDIALSRLGQAIGRNIERAREHKTIVYAEGGR
jgi:putative sigma-54 modulation protein